MTAMLTLRRADPCNRGAGGEQLLLTSSFPITPPVCKARDTTGHCQLPLELRGEGRKHGKVKAKRFVPGITAASCAGGAA